MSIQIEKNITTVQVEIPKTNVAIETAVTEITVQTSQPEIIIATAGVQGPTGPRGFDTGTSGTSGTSGVNGTSGTSGINGTSGTNGTTGTAGSSGTSGINGTNGSSGTTGSSGTSGVSGSNGTSGTSGINGTSGTSGVSGSSGTNGTSGTSGTSGVSGSDGTSGTSGTSGTTGLTAFTALKLFAGGDAGSYTVDYGYFNYNAYGNSLAIAKTPLFNSYLDFVGTGSQNWTLKSLNPTYPSFTIDLGTPQNNNEIPAPSKDIWVLPFTGVNIPQLVGVPNGNEYAFYLTKTGALGTSGTSGVSGSSGTSGVSGSSGTSGVSGEAGSSGTSGVSGSSGTSGVSGENGTFFGSSGTSGVSGTSGTSGIGSSGSSGTSGLRGDSLFALTGSVWATTNTLEITGSLTISSSATFTNIGLANFIGKQTTTGSLNVTDSVNINSPEPNPLSIGDSFGGGKLAYILTPTDAGYDSTLIKGIVAATADEATTQTWTNAITASNNKVANGYDDWYLPSKDELNKLYLNKDAIGGFVNATYWSSTQSSSTLAWFQIFSTGTQTVSTKTFALNFRAIRAFSIPKNALNIIGNTTITGSLNVSGSTTITGSLKVSGSLFLNEGAILSTASLPVLSQDHSYFGIGDVANYPSDLFLADASIFIAIRNNYPISNGPGAQIQVKSGSQVSAWYYDGDGTSYLPGDVNIGFDAPLSAYSTSGSLNIKNGNINLSGSLNVSSSLTASLREGYVWVGDNTGKSTLQIATSSFATGGGSGTSGTSGTSGVSGSSGTSGTSGTSGVSGSSGTSGFSIESGSFATTGSNAFSGSQYISGSVIPNTGAGTYTSSFSLGSATNAWKDIWVSEGSINFVNSLTGVTSSISLNTTTNQIVVSNLNINTASLDSRIIAIETAALSASYFSSSIQLTGSFDERYTQTSSLNTFTGSVNSYTSSNDSVRNRILQTTASLNSKTGSYATTGSNTFIGNQTISGSLLVTDTIQGTGSIFLQPDINDGRKIEIYNTGPYDVHIKGTTGLTFLGDDTNYVKIDDGQQMVSIDSANGIFFNQIPPSIGQVLAGGKVAYILTPTDAGYDSTLIKGIVAAEADEAGGSINWYAATASIDNKTTNGYTDWYLPSKDELNQLYINRVAIGGFDVIGTEPFYTPSYWSSTEVYGGVWLQVFSTGGTSQNIKTTEANVRAVRQFSIPKNTLNVNGIQTITGSLNVTGSVNIDNVIKLAPVTNFPNGQAGMLVASASYGKTNLYVYDGSNWKWLVTGSIA